MKAPHANRKIKLSVKFKGHFFETLTLLIYIMRMYTPIARNVLTPIGEVDLVFIKHQTLYIIEVKYRKEEEASLLAIHPKQKERLLRQALYLKKKYKSKEVKVEAVFFFSSFPFCRFLDVE